MEQVVWLPVVGYEGRYLVSNDGRVRSLDIQVSCSGGKTRLYRGRIKPLFQNNRGYVMVSLCRDNKTTHELVHRLVASAFIDNPHNKPQVNHIDGDNTNNHADNLEWVTDNENKKHSSVLVGGTQRPKRPVVVTNIITKDILFYDGLREAERALNLDHGSVMKMMQGRQRSHRGYHIAYKDGGDAQCRH